MAAEEEPKGVYYEAMTAKLKEMAGGLVFYISQLPEPLQQPMIDYLTTGDWVDPKEDE